MTQKEIEKLTSEGIEIRHWFDNNLSEFGWKQLNRLIEIELQLEAECGQ
jgi:hypothetical protein